MSTVTSSRSDSVTTITIDDGKANVMSPATIAALNAALDEAERDGDVVILTGRPGLLSAGFDLKVLTAGGDEALGMLRGGFELAARLLVHPRPVVVACPGHAVAMGVFVLLTGDYLIGCSGEYRLTANEVAIGMTQPHSALAILRHRLTPAGFTRAALLAEVFTPATAVSVGLLDRVVEPDQLMAEATALAGQLATLDMRAHAASKRRARQATVDAVLAGIELDFSTSIAGLQAE